MITYKYKARNPATGEKVESELQADSKKSASLLIQKLGYAPIEITELENTKSSFSRLLNRVRAKDRIMFSRQLATLINAGLPLVQSLRSVQDQTSNKYFKTVVSLIISDVEAGKPMSTALAKHPEIFNNVYISLVAAGETSGTLDKALERLAAQQEKDAEIVSKVRGALTYPVLIVFVMIGVVSFMLVKVIPEVEKFYSTMGDKKLPTITEVMLRMSDLTVEYWWIVLGLLIATVVFITRWIKTSSGRLAIDRLKIKVPPTNQLMNKLYMARFARTAHTLVGSGVPLLQVIEVTAHSINNVVIEDSLRLVADKVKGGKSLSEAISANPYFSDIVSKMISIGEQSGSLDQMLGQLANIYEKEVDNQIKTISTLIEPVMMIMLGAVVLIIVAAVLLPIYSLAGQSFGN